MVITFINQAFLQVFLYIDLMWDLKFDDKETIAIKKFIKHSLMRSFNNFWMVNSELNKQSISTDQL